MKSHRLLKALPAIIIMLIAFLNSAICMAATVAETTIKISVKNEHEKPVPNAAVVLDFLGSRQVMKLGMHKKMHWEVHTNQEGFAHFPPVPEGTVQLQIITSKYQTYGQKIEIEGPEKLLEITLHPPQSQYSAHPALKPADPPK
jgi:hypothetical protein